MTLASHFGHGVTPAFRGRRLWGGAASRRVLTRWVRFFKRHRRVLNGDVIHSAGPRPEADQVDAILHVAADADDDAERALLLLLNTASRPQLATTIRPPPSGPGLLYYSGLHDTACAFEYPLRAFDESEAPPPNASWRLASSTDGGRNPWEGRMIPPKSAIYFVFRESGCD